MCDPAHGGPTNPSYFENIQQQTGPLIKDFEARVVACSAAHCSGHGRCKHVPETKLQSTAGAVAATCVCFEGFSGPACAEQNQLETPHRSLTPAGMKTDDVQAVSLWRSSLGKPS